jgi:hypothetical protein
LYLQISGSDAHGLLQVGAFQVGTEQIGSR